MCGFAGYIHNYGTFDKEEVIHKMADRIKHRGPDDAHYYIDDGIALGFRRLSIIDLEGGNQPMVRATGAHDSIVTSPATEGSAPGSFTIGDYAIVFNGEIYNFQELTAELMRVGHTFATRSDTEVLLHGYEQWGNQLPGKLRGMFTFVIWDQKTKTMFGARDIFGIKPFYYYNQDGLFLFGSEIKSFLAHPGFKKELNEEQLPLYLSYQYSPGEDLSLIHI